MTESPSLRYVRLGLQVGRHVDGIVDAYIGPPQLESEVDDAPPVAPRELVASAEALRDALDDGWLRDQVLGLRAYAGVLAGEAPSYVDEIAACYGVRPHRTDDEVFAVAHDRLGELLPGDGPLGQRKEHWEESMRVPPDRLERTLTAVIREAREQTNGLVPLPETEDVTLEIVRDKPWLAFCRYLGGYRSRISVNVDLPMSGFELLVLAMHETYPGHHAERSCKEESLVGRRGLLEETLVLVPTPQSVVSEGIATVAPELLLGGDGAPALAAAVREEAGIDLDLDHALAVERALEPCAWAELNAALMLHEDGASEADVTAYLERWALLTPELATHVVRFLQEPTSRTYIITYLSGRELTRGYVGDDPARFRRLLTEQVRIGELLGAAAGRTPPP